MDTAWIDTPIGTLKVCGDADGINEVSFTEFTSEGHESVPDPLKDAVRQLEEYFEKKRNEFHLRLNPNGTDFQKKVWKILEEVSYGKTRSYQQIANRLGDPKVIRAAASANGKNPIAIIIPCHRIVGSDGSLTGYAGGLHRKKWLLEHESPVKQTQLF